MYLRDVMVLPNSPGDLKRNIGLLRQASDHVVDIFRHHLPAKFDLHGLRRVVVYLGNHTPPQKQYSEIDGVGDYHIADFDLCEFLRKPGSEQEEAILKYIEKALLDLSYKFETDPDPLMKAVQTVRESGFRLEIELGLSKTHRSKKFRVNVIRRFAPGGITIRAEVRNRSGELLASQELLSNAWIVAANDAVRRSRWNGDTLDILDWKGSLTASVPCGLFLEA